MFDDVSERWFNKVDTESLAYRNLTGGPYWRDKIGCLNMFDSVLDKQQATFTSIKL